MTAPGMKRIFMRVVVVLSEKFLSEWALDCHSGFYPRDVVKQGISDISRD